MMFNTYRMESERLTSLYCFGKFLGAFALWVWGSPWWGILTAPLTFKWFLPPLAATPGTQEAWMSYWIYGVAVVVIGYAIAVVAKVADAVYRSVTPEDTPQYHAAD